MNEGLQKKKEKKAPGGMLVWLEGKSRTGDVASLRSSTGLGRLEFEWLRKE